MARNQGLRDSSLAQRNIYDIMDRWEQQTSEFDEMEDLIDTTMNTLITHRPGRFSKKFDEEGMKLALETYLSFMKTGGALREAIKELRSLHTRFPGQIMDCENATPQIIATCRAFPEHVKGFIKLYGPLR